MPTIKDTIAFIQKAHAGQFTKGGEPYWTHPVAVMELIKHYATIDELHAALLHDVLEDTSTTSENLRDLGYSERTIWLVERLSRPKGPNRPSYMNWIRSLVETGDIGLLRIKLGDNQHNTVPERVAMLPESERGIVDRYARSMRILNEAISNLEKN